MQTFITSRIKWVVFLASLIMFSCISNDSVRRQAEVQMRDLAKILADGKLVAVTDYNSTSYFLYKGEPMGYQYDLLRDLASYLGVKLELIAENDIEKSFEMLKNGEVDIIANNLTITTQRKKEFNFTTPHGETRQVLVQRVPSTSEESEKLIVKSPLDLSGKVIYVQRSSAAAQRLANLSEEIGGNIMIVELPDYDAEQLIDLVAMGEIDYMVCDETVAQIKASSLRNVDYSIAIGFPQHTAWALRQSSPDLLNKVNTWFDGYLSTSRYAMIKRKYYQNPNHLRRLSNDYYFVHQDRVSEWDEYFKKNSPKINWDWRLLASLVYQESRFRHDVVSHKGASGVMQFMPQTAEHWGIDSTVSAKEQIEVGVKYLKWLDDKMVEYNISQEERVKFVLAAYNAGIGHVIDARNLARKYGKDPNVWDENVEYFIRHKSEFLSDTVVRFGRLRGEETFRYVSEIIDRYEHYKNILK
ncbi:MAG TPA: transporter substrate-binding domain-containing protein [Tenuifilaceae bacterium]|nr:transporter substrate-binding domain-containing protein [Tenuifilaceae bacterium]HPI44489.1 transporter substrate-binding domain-containing protein [Tenuifilaceae bacterium]HPV56214.1 transporter substrate-binding domain-containing protein [Tenuifilaceae bacterium]